VKRKIWRAGLGAVAAAALLALGVALYVAAVPYPRERLDPAGHRSLRVTDRHGELLRELPLPDGGRAVWVSLDRIAPALIDATLAGEDRRFFAHHGLDAGALGRALLLAARERRVVSGASTITMQLVRVIEPHPRSLGGKLGELVTALRLERAASKREILEQYLNRVYYGGGAYGAEAAARRFFGKPAAALSPGEATLLAVLPRWPQGYDPGAHLPAALARRAHVLALMEKNGTLSPAARARLEAEPLQLRPAAALPSAAPHFVDWVLAQAPVAAARAAELRTTLDLPLQRRLEAAVAARAGAPGGQAGVLVLDPANGDVLAMVGSIDHAAADAGQVNITTTPRHPGSTLKPFLYALALEAGDTPATLAADLADAVPGYRPRRPPHEHGPTRYREALAGSLNLAAISVVDRVGVPALLERLRAAGLGPLGGSAPEYGLDLALGAGRVRLVELAAAYGFLVDAGRVHRPRFLIDAPVAAEPLFSPAVSYLVLDMLADTGARRAVFGAELPLDLPFPVAAKTGTSSGFADTLTLAATREAVVAAWAGAFDGSGTQGTLAMWSAAPLARAALLAVRDRRGAPLTLPAPPPGIVARDVCRISGQLAGAGCPVKHERFTAAHAPAATCGGHQPLLRIPPAETRPGR
jgi:penicillin-binding protein 1C